MQFRKKSVQSVSEKQRVFRSFIDAKNKNKIKLYFIYAFVLYAQYALCTLKYNFFKIDQKIFFEKNQLIRLWSEFRLKCETPAQIEWTFLFNLYLFINCFSLPLDLCVWLLVFMRHLHFTRCYVWSANNWVRTHWVTLSEWMHTVISIQFTSKSNKTIKYSNLDFLMDVCNDQVDWVIFEWLNDMNVDDVDVSAPIEVFHNSLTLSKNNNVVDWLTDRLTYSHYKAQKH